MGIGVRVRFRSASVVTKKAGILYKNLFAFPLEFSIVLFLKGNVLHCLFLCRQAEKEPRAFVIKPIPTANVKPVIVFINPKSGGNQGTKLLQKFQWHLNPRQVFDLTQGGPKMG